MQTKEQKKQQRSKPVQRRAHLSLGCIEPLETRRLFAVLTVNSTADTANATDQILTLRGAIEVVNGTLSFSSLSAAQKSQIDTSTPLGTNDTIDFNIPSSGEQTIIVDTLPAITSPVTINGYSQPGAAPATDSAPANILIRLNNASTIDTAGLTIQAPHTTVRGLAIDNFQNEGILLQAGSDQDVIAGNYLGMEADGESQEGNGSGVVILGANGAIIGGTTPADRNLISGNTVGIGIANVTSGQVEGNYIGLDATGAGVGGNDGAGVELINADNVTIGGNDIDQRNIISGNGGDGILIEGNNTTALTGDAILDNYIGTDVAGTLDEGNTENGIEIVGGGQSDSPATNVMIGSLASSQNILNEDSRNVIAANQGAGIYIHGSGASGNTIVRNYIGVSADGATALGNQIGISIDTADDNTIGGEVPGSQNLISASTSDGIRISNSRQTTIQENVIGVLVNSETAGGNGGDGIHLIGDTQRTTIGNSVSDDSSRAVNVIVNNAGDGIEISSSNGINPTLNTARGNIITRCV